MIVQILNLGHVVFKSIRRIGKPGPLEVLGKFAEENGLIASKPESRLLLAEYAPAMVSGKFRGRKIVIKCIRALDGKKLYDLTRVGLQCSNPDRFFFELSKKGLVSPLAEFNQRLKISTHLPATFDRVFDEELQRRFLEIWDDNYYSQFHLRDNTLFYEFKEFILKDSDLDLLEKRLNFMADLADRIEIPNSDSQTEKLPANRDLFF